MLVEQVKKTIEELKASGRVLTNVYSADVLSLGNVFIRNEHAALLAYNDRGVERLYYYAHSLQDIENLLTTLPGKEYVFEYMTKDPFDHAAILSDMDFICLAKMMRMSVRNCNLQSDEAGIRQFYDETVGVCPDVELAKDINKVLWSVFDTRVSHLLNDEEMVMAIKNKELLIHQNSGGDIDAVLQTVIQPHRFYINQIYNGANKSVIHAMLQKRLKKYTDAGGKYLYAWVDSNNIASIKFHKKYGLQHDGMWNMVYVLNKD